MFRDLMPTSSRTRLALSVIGIVGIAVGAGLLYMSHAAQQQDPAAARTATNLLVLPPRDDDRTGQRADSNASITSAATAVGIEQVQGQQPGSGSKNSVAAINSAEARRNAKQKQLSAARNKIASSIPYDASPLGDLDAVSSSLPPPPENVKAPAKPPLGTQVDMWLGNQESIVTVPPSREIRE